MHRLSDAFRDPVLEGCQSAAVFRLPARHEASYERNRANLPLGRTDWWAVSDHRLRRIDSVILLIDAFGQPGRVDVMAGRYVGYEDELRATASPVKARRALFVEGAFRELGHTAVSGLLAFSGLGTLEGTKYLTANRATSARRAPPTRQPSFSPEFAGRHGAVSPSGYVPDAEHGRVMSALARHLQEQRYEGLDNNPHDCSARPAGSADARCELFELKTGTSSQDIHTAIGQLLAYEHRLRVECGWGHARRVLVLPDGPAARARLPLLNTLGMHLMVYRRTRGRIAFERVSTLDAP